MARNVENQDEVELDENQEGGRKICQKKCPEENIWRKQCPPHGTHAMPRKGDKLCARARSNPHQSAEAHVYSGWDAVGDLHLVHQGESCPWKTTVFFFRAFFCLCFCALGMHPAFLKLKSLCLTFLAGIYFLRRMKLAGTNFLTPTVSRKAFFPLCYYASPHTMLNKLPRNICC